MTEKIFVKNLECLKSFYEEGLVSALIGAGFSKNIYKPFPNWPELLKDIVKELHPAEYNTAVRAQRKLKGTDEEDRPLNELVNRLGPLDMVSDYIRYKGIGHEAIDIYIERRVPYLEDRNGILYVGDTIIAREALSAHEALLNCEKFRNIYTTNYDNLIEKTREFLGISCFKSIITNSQDLSNSLSKQSIIKVHGDLRIRQEEIRNYEFDGDKNLLYIIAKEDYETYQLKHEAFSFMMRMAMLQGIFCLVGFSGTDPNFQFWLQWMKEVLGKDDAGYTKVYLIDFLTTDIDPDVELFYKNHRIGVINLLDKDVQNILFPDRRMAEIEEGHISTDTLKYNRKELLTALFIYLKGNTKEKPKRELGEYYSLWAEANRQIQESKVSTSVVASLLKVRESLGPQKSVQHQDLIIDGLLRKKSWTKAEADLFAIAVSDLGVTPSAFETSIGKIESKIEESALWNELRIRETSMSAEERILEGDDDKIKFENVLRLLFNLRFTELKEMLLSWSPIEEYQIKVALLTAFFDEHKARALSDGYLLHENEVPTQKVLSAKQVANILYGEFPGHYALDYYYDMGLFSFNEVVSRISDGIGIKRKRVLPYSIEDHSICLNPGKVAFCESSRLLSYLINWGYTTYYRYITCVPDETWMRAFCELFEVFPFALLYYSSLYRDSKVLRRIGQEYAFSRYLYEKDLQKELLKTILEGFEDKNMPWQNKTGLLYIASELYVAVKEKEWYEPFKRTVLQTYLEVLSDNADRHDAAYANVAKALDSIYQREHVEECFTLLVESITKNPVLITGLINDNLNIGSLSGGDFEEIIRRLIESHQMSDIYPIVYALYYNGLLASDVLFDVDLKIQKEGLLFAEKKKNALIPLSYLISSEGNLKE